MPNLTHILEERNKEFDEKFPCENLRARRDLAIMGYQLGKNGKGSCGCKNCRLRSLIQQDRIAVVEGMIADTVEVKNEAQTASERAIVAKILEKQRFWLSALKSKE